MSLLFIRWINVEFLESDLLKLMSKILRVVHKPIAIWNAFHFSNIAIPKKSYFTTFAIQNFVQNTNSWTREFILGSYFLGKWMVFSCLLPSRMFYLNNGARLLHFKMQKVFHLRQVFNGSSGHPLCDSKYLR